MSNAVEATKQPPGRPVKVPGRTVVVSLIIQPATLELLDASRGPMTFGDAFETLVRLYVGKVKMPKTEGRITASGKPQRYTGRTKVRSVRMSGTALAMLDESRRVSNSVRSDVAEALIQQFAVKLVRSKTA